MTTLDQSLRLEAALDTGSADVHVVFVDHIGIEGRVVSPQPTRSNLSGSSTSIILAMPAGNVKFREVENATVYNTHASAVACTIKTDDGTTERIVYKETIPAGQSLQYQRTRGWFRLSAA